MDVYTGTRPSRSAAAVGESAYIEWATIGRPAAATATVIWRATSASTSAKCSEYWL